MDDDSFILTAGGSRAQLSAIGAECRAWRVGDREMLWPGDPAVWPAVAPVLFPTCGWSRDSVVRVGGASYPMPVHGFAAQSRFSARRLSAGEVRFTLTDSPATRAHYPYPFELTLAYRLAPDALHVEIAVANRGQIDMPYACGLHPGFVWGEGAHRFVFAQDERAEAPIIAPGGLFSERRRPVPLEGRTLALTRDLFKAEALCFMEARSRAFRFEAPDGTLEIEAPDFPHLVLWNTRAAPFLAIESWTGMGDPEGFAGELHERPSMIRLAPGERRAHRVNWRWRPA